MEVNSYYISYLRFIVVQSVSGDEEFDIALLYFYMFDSYNSTVIVYINARERGWPLLANGSPIM